MKVGGVALALAALALGVALVGLRREDPQPQRPPMRMDRVAELEAQVAELAREVESLKVRQPERMRGEGPALPFVPRRTERDEGPPLADDAGGGTEELKAIVDDAVERKTEQVLDELRVKANRKPAIDVFASVLELTDEQRAQTERIVVEGQRKLHAILNMPTYDGTNLMDELVEIAAKGMADPGKDHGFGRWLGRVLSEKVPGTDETYGARIESVKTAMRASFKREWTEAQYSEFEAWGVDPTEVQQVPGSPNEALFERITERARVLGANLPD